MCLRKKINNVAHSYSSAASVSAGDQTALGCCPGDLELLSIQQQRSCDAHWNRHVTNDVLTASSHHLNKKIIKQGPETNRAFIYQNIGFDLNMIKCFTLMTINLNFKSYSCGHYGV